MSYKAEMILDSITKDGARITTMALTFPHIIAKEVLTHRRLSRNATSSRAITVEKMLSAVMENPFIPDAFPINGPGMQPAAYITEDEKPQLYREARDQWLEARDKACNIASWMRNGLKIHKEITNRLLEPWMWSTYLVTATDWDNFFGLRCHPDAQRQFQIIANLAYDAYSQSVPNPLGKNGWHAPYTDDKDTKAELKKIKYEDVQTAIKARCPELLEFYTPERFEDFKDLDCSVGRCTRISYFTFGDNPRRDPAEDIRLAVQLSAQSPGRWSAFEHVARPLDSDTDPHMVSENSDEIVRYSGNLRGYLQYRKMFGTEEIREFKKV